MIFVIYVSYGIARHGYVKGRDIGELSRSVKGALDFGSVVAANDYIALRGWSDRSNPAVGLVTAKVVRINKSTVEVNESKVVRWR